MKSISEIKSASIKWTKHKENGRYFYFQNEDGLLLLRMNDFPDEPLLTLIVGLNIIDIEDVPEKWEVPF